MTKVSKIREKRITSRNTKKILVSVLKEASDQCESDTEISHEISDSLHQENKSLNEIM